MKTPKGYRPPPKTAEEGLGLPRGFPLRTSSSETFTLTATRGGKKGGQKGHPPSTHQKENNEVMQESGLLQSPEKLTLRAGVGGWERSLTVSAERPSWMDLQETRKLVP